MFFSYIIPSFKKNIGLFICFIVIVFLELVKKDPALIDKYYSSLFYINNSKIFLYYFGEIPFSLGDFLYLLIPVFLFLLNKNQNTRRKNLKISFQYLAVIYIFFQLQWGLNYHRTPLIDKFSIKNTYNFDSLIKATDLFIENTNRIHKKISNSDTIAVSFNIEKEELFNNSINAIKTFDHPYIINKIKKVSSVKNSILSTPLSYMGFSGYINPFTLEAQINVNTPQLYLPTTICHEIAHQMGYSAENEANFIGILAAISSENNLISYSGYVQGLRHLLNEIYKTNKTIHSEIVLKLNKGVVLNIQQANNELKKYTNPLEPYIKKMYDYFLKANKQTAGIKSYSLVVNLLVNEYSNQ